LIVVEHSYIKVTKRKHFVKMPSVLKLLGTLYKETTTKHLIVGQYNSSKTSTYAQVFDDLNVLLVFMVTVTRDVPCVSIGQSVVVGKLIPYTWTFTCREPLPEILSGCRFIKTF